MDRRVKRGNREERQVRKKKEGRERRERKENEQMDFLKKIIELGQESFFFFFFSRILLLYFREFETSISRDEKTNNFETSVTLLTLLLHRREDKLRKRGAVSVIYPRLARESQKNSKNSPGIQKTSPEPHIPNMHRDVSRLAHFSS